MRHAESTNPTRLLIGDIEHELTPDEQTIITHSINSFSGGGHPYADNKTIEFFTVEFVRDLIRDNVSNIPPTFQAAARDLVDTLNLALKDIEESKTEIDAEELERARIAFRQTLKPYDIVKTKDGERVEIMSFPFNEEDSPVFVVFARMIVGDPTSAKYIRVDSLDVASR